MYQVGCTTEPARQNSNCSELWYALVGFYWTNQDPGYNCSELCCQYECTIPNQDQWHFRKLLSPGGGAPQTAKTNLQLWWHSARVHEQPRPNSNIRKLACLQRCWTNKGRCMEIIVLSSGRCTTWTNRAGTSTPVCCVSQWGAPQTSQTKFLALLGNCCQMIAPQTDPN
jgi:hypothetical protein